MRQINLPRGEIAINGTSEYYKTVAPAALAHLLTASERLIPANSFVLDIGANIGVTALLMAQYATAGVVHAFEPHPETFALLKANIGANNAHNIIAHGFGLGEFEQTVLFRDRDRYDTGNGVLQPGSLIARTNETIEVELRRAEGVLSEFPKGKIDFVKIDVEGYELDVLKGFGHRLGDVRATFLEFNHWCISICRRVLPEDVLTEILDLFEYVAWFDKGQLKAIKTDPEKLEFLRRTLLRDIWNDLLCTNHRAVLDVFAESVPANN